jgi:hypothetical protein
MSQWFTMKKQKEKKVGKTKPTNKRLALQQRPNAPALRSVAASPSLSGHQAAHPAGCCFPQGFQYASNPVAR